MLTLYVQSKQIYMSRSSLMTASLQRSKKRVCILSCLMGHKSERLLGFQARTWSSYSVWISMASTRSISSVWNISCLISYNCVRATTKYFMMASTGDISAGLNLFVGIEEWFWCTQNKLLRDILFEVTHIWFWNIQAYLCEKVRIFR